MSFSSKHCLFIIICFNNYYSSSVTEHEYFVAFTAILISN